MLTDILGVLIAFLSIILLLSMVITALVQVTQSVLRLRARNLLKGVSAILQIHALNPPSKRMELRKVAARILNADHLATIDKVEAPEAFWRHGILGPKISWAEPAELAKAIRTQLALKSTAPAANEALERDIERMQPAWSKRFQYFVRLITIGWALIVAVTFQVSTPELLGALSSDPQRVQRVVDEQPASGQLAAEVEDIAQQLEQFGIGFWHRGSSFYIDDTGALRVPTLMGVLLTAILLSFGAPFWYEQLRNLVALRDLSAAKVVSSVLPSGKTSKETKNRVEVVVTGAAVTDTQRSWQDRRRAVRT